MSLVHYEPWRGFGQLQNEINRVFSVFGNDNETSAATASWIPAVDIHEDKDHFYLLVDLPGVDPKTVDITLDDGVLAIAGERDTAKSDEGGDMVSRRNERRSGRFYRRFNLPDTVDADNVRATNRFGVLEIAIPKQEKAKPRRIEVAA